MPPRWRILQTLAGIFLLALFSPLFLLALLQDIRTSKKNPSPPFWLTGGL